MIQNHIQNIGFQYIYEKTNICQSLVTVCDVLTSFNKIGAIQSLLLHSGKYKLWYFLIYVLIIA